MDANTTMRELLRCIAIGDYATALTHVLDLRNLERGAFVPDALGGMDAGEVLNWLDASLKATIQVQETASSRGAVWMIYKNHLTGDDCETYGGRPDARQRVSLRARLGAKFRLYDSGDGEPLFEGCLLGDKYGPDAFAPLDSFGAPIYGCTEIRYQASGGAWDVPRLSLTRFSPLFWSQNRWRMSPNTQTP